MSASGIFQIAEAALLLFFLIRFGIFWFRNGTWAKGHESILLYFGVMVINSATYLFHWNPNFFFIHTATPTLVAVCLVWPRAWGWFYSSMIVAVAALSYKWTDSLLMLVLNYTALFLLLRQGIVLAQSRSDEVARSSVYMILAFDLFATMLTLILKFTPFDWSQSELTGIMHYLRLAIFLTTLIFMHVRLRRFIVA